MLTTFYTYRALAEEWNALLPGENIKGAYSVARNEITITLRSGSALVYGLHGAFRYLYRSERIGRPRRNAAEVLPSIVGQEIREVGVAPRDRRLIISLAGGNELHFILYGPRPTVLVADAGSVADGFKATPGVISGGLPESRPARPPISETEFVEAANEESTTAGRLVRRAFVLFDEEMSREAAHRCGVDVGVHRLTDAAELYRSAVAVAEAAETPAGVYIYWDKYDRPEALSLLPLMWRANDREEAFDSVDAAVRVFCRARLRKILFLKNYEPVLRAVNEARDRARKRLEEVERRLLEPSRAEQYERWGHLLMAAGKSATIDADTVHVPDVFGAGDLVAIPVDADKSAVENAERLYERARSNRAARAAADARLEQDRKKLNVLESAARALADIDSREALKRFLIDYEAELGPVLGKGRKAPGASARFRHFALGAEYHVYVGRSAAENDALTFGFARKFDIWMHARGVAGSHVILRLPSRDASPDERILERAASVAAYFSKARGSEFVPVAYAPKKFVRKLKGGGPGQVAVDREKVVIVPPILPGD